MKKGLIILLTILVFMSIFVSAFMFKDLWGKITGRATNISLGGWIPSPKEPVEIDFECTVDATNCASLGYDNLMYGLISTQDVWDGYKFTPQKVCIVYENGKASNSWSFQQPGCAIIKELESNDICIDSDGGKNYFIKGTLKGNANTASDCCIKDGTTEGPCLSESNTLNEYYCQSNKYAVETYECSKGCLNGACLRQEGHGKDLSKYSNKEVFLISDEDWKNVLSLVPVAIWTNENSQISKYPLLIYHKENEAFDIDSIYHFLNQYNAEKVTYFGNLPAELKSLLEDSLTVNQGGNLLEYWKSYEELIYVEDDYTLSLIASTYASLINAPLIIKGYNDNIDLSQKKVICVGNPTLNCDEKYSLEQLQNKYIEKTNTDKLILINPLDRNIFTSEDNFKPEKSTKNIRKIYGFDSLAAPILASGKHELIIATLNTNYDLVDLDIESNIKKLNLNPQYLTIIGSPDAIQNYKENNTIILPDSTYNFSDSEVEWVYYSDINKDEIPDIALGRIYGITLSDTSSYIARSLFIDSLTMSRKYIILSHPTGIYYVSINAFALGKYFENELEGVTNFMETPGFVLKDYIKNNVVDKTLISTYSHGNAAGAIIISDVLKENELYFSPSVYVANACLTCSYQDYYEHDPEASKTRLFCANLLRRGVIGFVGAVDFATQYPNRFMYYLGKNQDLGTAMKNDRIDWYSKVISTDKVGDTDGSYQAGRHEFLKGNSILLGDPTINLNFNINSDNNHIEYEVNQISSKEKKLVIQIPKPTEKIVEIVEPIYSGDPNETFSAWIIPSYENVLQPYYIEEIYNPQGILNYQTATGLIQIKDSSIDSLYSPTSVVYINKEGERTNLSYIEGSQGSFFESGDPNQHYFLIQIGIINNRISIRSHEGQLLSGEPNLGQSSYEIIFSLNNTLKTTDPKLDQDLCNGCYVEGSCIPYEARSTNKYCDLDNQMKQQKSARKSCENNFECESNVCKSNKCLSKDARNKFLSWFRGLFN